NPDAGVLGRTELQGQSVHTYVQDRGGLRSDKRHYLFEPYSAVTEHAAALNIARQQGHSADARSPLPSILASALFAPARRPDAPYLIETDPRFTDGRQWVSSDTLLHALGADPTRLHKRLGD